MQRLSGKPETWVLTLCGCPHSDTLDTGAGCHRLACLTLKVQFPVRGDHLLTRHFTERENTLLRLIKGL